MSRIILYGVFGFLISGIVGIVVASSVYNGEYSIGLNILAGVITLIGTYGSVWFAKWMNSRGEQKLEQFSSRPKMFYGICGVVVGGLVGLQIARHVDPVNSFSGLDLLGIGISIILGGRIGLYIARRLNLSTPPGL